jgi:predicted nucleic acid-binding protein
VSSERQVVSDTGPLITLEKLPDGFRFIRLLYDEILVPSAVLQEVVQGQFGEAEAYLAHYGIQDLIRVVEIDSQQEMAGLDILDQGEQEAIRLALKENLLLLIEEEAGRAVAQQLGIRISGIAGQVLRAFRNDQIGADEAVQKLRVLYEAGRINRRIYEGLTDAVQRVS